MHKRHIDFKCPACTEVQSVPLRKKPTSMESAKVKVECRKCKSRYLLFVEKDQALKPGQFRVGCTVLGLSDSAAVMVANRTEKYAGDKA